MGRSTGEARERRLKRHRRRRRLAGPGPSARGRIREPVLGTELADAEIGGRCPLGRGKLRIPLHPPESPCRGSSSTYFFRSSMHVKWTTAVALSPVGNQGDPGVVLEREVEPAGSLVESCRARVSATPTASHRKRRICRQEGGQAGSLAFGLDPEDHLPKQPAIPAVHARDQSVGVDMATPQAHSAIHRSEQHGIYVEVFHDGRLH